MLRRAAAVIVVTAAAFVASPVQLASAAFGGQAAGPGNVEMQTIPGASAPVTVATGPNVALVWDATTLSGGTPATRYVVRRYNAANVAQVVGAGCLTVTTPNCVENSVPGGTWTYSVQAQLGSWSGPEGDRSAAITVATATFTITSPQLITTLPSTVSGTIAGYVNNEDLTFRLDSVSGTILAGTPAKSGAGPTAVTITVPVGTTAAAHSIFVIGSLGTTTAASINIVVPPSLMSLAMYDTNANGKIDRVLAVFDQTLATYTAGVAPWVLANIPSTGSLSSVTVAGTTATLNITEGPGAAATAVGTFTIRLNASSSGIRNVGGNQSSFAARAPTDAAAPARLTMNMTDGDLDGKVDGVMMSFSEALAAYTAPTSVWGMASVPSAGTLASVAVATSNVTMIIAEGAGAANTAVGPFTIALAASATGIRDAAGNQASFAATTPADAARPVLVTFTDTNGTVDGQFQPGDKLILTFSEPLDTTFMPTSITLTLTDPSGKGNDTFSVGDGEMDTGGTNYETRNDSSAGFASSPVTFAGAVITVTIGPACSGDGCSGLGQQLTATPVSILPPATLNDPSGNLIVSVVKTISMRLF
jgi:hypothetical protein